MTKAQIVDQVILAINGGSLTSEASVQRSDVFSLVNAAIELALFQTDTQRIVNGLRLFRTSGSVPELVQLKLVTYTLTPVRDESRRDHYITLPGRPYENNTHKIELSPLFGPASYVYATNLSQIPSDYNQSGLVFYWIEQTDTGNYLLRIKNLTDPVCDHIVRARLDISSTGDDVELGLPSGVDLLAIESLMAFFQVQKGVSQEFKLNYTDDRQEA
jgi:hypothetical protein